MAEIGNALGIDPMFVFQLMKNAASVKNPPKNPYSDRAAASRTRSDQSYQDYRRQGTEYQDAVRNQNPLPGELQPQFDAMRATGNQLNSGPVIAPPRQINGVRGGLQTLGLMLNATRNPQSGQPDLLGAGIGALLAQIFGDKGKIGQQVASMYDQPTMDANRKRMLDQYQTQADVLKSQLPFVRNQQANDLEARKVGLGMAQTDMSRTDRDADFDAQMAFNYDKLNQPQFHTIPQGGSMLVQRGTNLSMINGGGANQLTPTQQFDRFKYGSGQADDVNKLVTERNISYRNGLSMLDQAKENEKAAADAVGDKAEAYKAKAIDLRRAAAEAFNKSDSMADSLVQAYPNLFHYGPNDPNTGRRTLAWEGDVWSALRNSYSGQSSDVKQTGLFNR